MAGSRRMVDKHPSRTAAWRSGTFVVACIIAALCCVFHWGSQPLGMPAASPTDGRLHWDDTGAQLRPTTHSSNRVISDVRAQGTTQRDHGAASDLDGPTTTSTAAPSTAGATNAADQDYTSPATTATTASPPFARSSAVDSPAASPRPRPTREECLALLANAALPPHQAVSVEGRRMNLTVLLPRITTTAPFEEANDSGSTPVSFLPRAKLLGDAMAILRHVLKSTDRVYPLQRTDVVVLGDAAGLAPRAAEAARRHTYVVGWEKAGVALHNTSRCHLPFEIRRLLHVSDASVVLSSDGTSTSNKSLAAYAPFVQGSAPFRQQHVMLVDSVGQGMVVHPGVSSLLCDVTKQPIAFVSVHSGVRFDSPIANQKGVSPATVFLECGYIGYVPSTNNVVHDVHAVAALQSSQPSDVIVWVLRRLAPHYYTTLVRHVPCAAQIDALGVAGVQQAALVRLWMTKRSYLAVYDSGRDVVSDSILKYGGWEADAVQTLLNALRLADSLYRNQRAVYIDVGGNVGSIAVPIAASGRTVRIFEMMPSNVALLNYSKCVNGLVNMTINHVALSEDSESEDLMRHNTEATLGATTHSSSNATHRAAGRPRTGLPCVMLSDTSNRGDGIIRCGKEYSHAPVGEPLSPANPTLLVIGRTVQTTLSDQEVFTHHDGVTRFVMKIDVEGHEVQVMGGGKAVLCDPVRQPLLVYSEVWRSIDLHSYAALMIGCGYVGHHPPTGHRIDSIAAMADFADRICGTVDTIVWIVDNHYHYFVSHLT